MEKTATSDAGSISSVQRKNCKIFFGWWTVLASGIMGLWGWGSVLYSFGTLFQPLNDEFGWSRVEIAVAGSFRQIEGATPIGWFTDKFGPKLMCYMGTFLAGLGFILLYFINSLWSFYLIYGGVISVGSTLWLSANLDKAIAEWFVKRRGLATGMYRAIIALQVVPPIVAFLLVTFGWRIAFVIVGLITWSIGLPLAFLCMKSKRPEHYKLLPDGEAVDAENIKDKDSMIRLGQEFVAKKHGEVEFTAWQAIKTKSFSLLVVTSALGGLLWPVISMHLIPYLTDLGINEIAAATIMGLVITLGLPSRFIGGVLGDRVSIAKLKYLILLARCLQTLGMLLLIMATDLSMVYAFAVVYSFGYGLDLVVLGLMRARFFGRKAFGTIMTLVHLLALPISVSAPIYVGWMRDITGSYKSALTLTLTIFALGLISYLFLNPPKQKPQVVSDIEKILT